MAETNKSKKSRTPALLFFFAITAIAGFYLFEKNQEPKQIMNTTAPMPLETGEDKVKKRKQLIQQKQKKKAQSQ